MTKRPKNAPLADPSPNAGDAGAEGVVLASSAPSGDYVPFRYADIKAINWSSLKHIHTSPKLYKYRLDNPEGPKPDYIIGNAIHCLALEPEQFDTRYAVCGVTRNAKHKAYQEWMEEHPGAEALKQGEMDRVRASVDALLSDPHAGPLLKRCRVEEPITWTHPGTGYKCKGRVDAISLRDS